MVNNHKKLLRIINIRNKDKYVNTQLKRKWNIMNNKLIELSNEIAIYIMKKLS